MQEREAQMIQLNEQQRQELEYHGQVLEPGHLLNPGQVDHGIRAVHEFCATDLSREYFEVLKDRLYCDAAGSPVAV